MVCVILYFLTGIYYTEKERKRVMKKLKKAVVLAVLTVVMAMMPSVSAKAEDLEWGKGYSISASHGSDRVGYDYTFTLPSSGTVTIVSNCTKSSFHAQRYYILDSSDASVWYSEYFDTGLETYKLDLLAGEYTLRLSTRWDTDISFTLNFIPSGETLSESYINKNNQVGTATSYTVGSTVKAHLAKNDDTDIYKMTVNKAGYLTMNFNSNMTKFDMQMVSEDGETSYNESGIPLGASSYKYFVPKGTYYISFVQDYKDYTGTYTFSTKLSGITVTKVKSAKNLKGEKAKITWVKKNDVDGYQVQVAQNKKFTKGKKTKTITNKKTKSYTFTKLKKNKTYYARVCTYKLVDGKKIYSDWSVPKKFKVKK